MSTQLTASIARIFGPEGRVVGAGFLISKTHLLTCAHVIIEALGIPEETTETPSGRVRLDFPLVARGGGYNATVVGWRPLNFGSEPSHNGEEDIAVLQLDLEGGDTPNATGIRLTNADDVWGHSFRAFGFPSGYDEGVWVSGQLLARQGNGWIQIEGNSQFGYFVTLGFSGTAVLDETKDGVVGMVVVSDKKADTKAAFIIPVDTLTKVWPDLGKQSSAHRSDGPSPATTTDPTLDLNRQVMIRRIRKHEKIDAKIIANVAFHPKGQLMAYSLDNRLFLLQLNDVFAEQLGVHAGNQRIFSQTSDGTHRTTVSPDSSQRELTSGSESRAHIHRITDISFSPDGKLVASSDTNGIVKFWSLEHRECVAELSEHSDATTSISFSRQGNLFASAGYDEFINVWKIDDIQSQHPKPFKTFEKKSRIKKPPKYQHDIEQIISMTFSHNGKHLASGDQQGVVVVREIASEAEVYRSKIHNGQVASIAFSPTNKALLATASWDKRIRLTDFFAGGKPVTLGVGADKHTDSVVSIAFASGGDVLVSSGTDKLVKLWDIHQRRLIYSYKTEDDRPVERVAFFPNQYDFATNTYSSDISLWDITNEGIVANTLIDFE